MTRLCLRAVLWMAVLSPMGCLNPTGKCWKDEHCSPATCDRSTHQCRMEVGDGGSDLGVACRQVAALAQPLSVNFAAVAMPAAAANLGAALTVVGDTLLVGAPRHVSGALTTGGVYAVNGLSATAGTAQALLTPSPPMNGQYVGFTLAAAGDVVLAGPDLTQGGTEAVYLFHKLTGSYSGGMQIKATTLGAFGSAVAYDGTGSAYVGAPANADVANTQGAVYPLDVSAGTLGSPVPSRVGQASGRFGSMLALTPSSILVASAFENLGVMVKVGAVYTVSRSTLTIDAAAPYVPVPSTPNAQFGIAMASVGNTLLVGSGVGGGTNRAYWFHRPDATMPFVLQATLASPDPLPQFFGFTVALLSESVAAIGDTGAGGGAGAVYLYDLTQADATLGRRLIQTVKPADSPPNASFSMALATSGAKLYVGAPGAGTAGAIYVVSCQ